MNVLFHIQVKDTNCSFSTIEELQQNHFKEGIIEILNNMNNDVRERAARQSLRDCFGEEAAAQAVIKQSQ